MVDFVNSPHFGKVPKSALNPIENYPGSLIDRTLTKEDKWMIGFHIDMGQPFRLVFKPVKEQRDRYESIVVEGDSEVVQVTPVYREGGK